MKDLSLAILVIGSLFTFSTGLAQQSRNYSNTAVGTVGADEVDVRSAEFKAYERQFDQYSFNSRVIKQNGYNMPKGNELSKLGFKRVLRTELAAQLEQLEALKIEMSHEIERRQSIRSASKMSGLKKVAGGIFSAFGVVTLATGQGEANASEVSDLEVHRNGSQARIFEQTQILNSGKSNIEKFGAERISENQK